MSCIPGVSTFRTALAAMNISRREKLRAGTRITEAPRELVGDDRSRRRSRRRAANGAVVR